MIIIRAKENEYEAIRQFYYSVIEAVKNAEYKPMWQKDIYPSPEQIQTALAEQTIYYGLEGDRIAAAMVVNGKYNPEYNDASWKVDAKEGEVMVIHMLGVHSDFTGRGFAKQMVRFALDLAKDAGMKVMRLDVLKGNVPAERLYPAMGFEYIETVPMYYDNTDWMDFELFEHAL